MINPYIYFIIANNQSIADFSVSRLFQGASQCNLVCITFEIWYNFVRYITIILSYENFQFPKNVFHTTKMFDTKSRKVREGYSAKSKSNIIDVTLFSNVCFNGTWYCRKTLNSIEKKLYHRTFVLQNICPCRKFVVSNFYLILIFNRLFS